MDLNHRPPGPEISVQNEHVVDSVSLKDQITSSPLRMLHPILHPKLVKDFSAAAVCNLNAEMFYFCRMNTAAAHTPRRLKTRIEQLIA